MRIIPKNSFLFLRPEFYMENCKQFQQEKSDYKKGPEVRKLLKITFW